MKNFYVGIDISKEKLNLCYKKGLETILEEECENDVKAISRTFKTAFKALDIHYEDVLVCAEYTGRYIYPLTVSCQDMGLFLWIDDPTRIRNSFGIIRGKNDAVDAVRIAEYACRYSDKAVRYSIADKELVSLKNLLSDRDFLLKDRKRYQIQLTDQKKYMDSDDFKEKSSRWKKILKTINETIDDIDVEIEKIFKENKFLSHQKELLLSIDGIGDRIATSMIVITVGFTRFKDARHFCSFAGLTPYKYESGSSIRSKSKISKKANQGIKALLHLSAVNVATRMKKGEYREYYERKINEGKHVMCVLNVIRAKLVHRMFAIIKRDEAYVKSYKPKEME